jgi:hypothetical protein
MSEWETRLASLESLLEEKLQQLTVNSEQLKAEVEQLKFEEAVRQIASQNLNQLAKSILLPTASDDAAIQGRAAPRNCAGIAQIGHRLSGLYLVQAATSQVQTVYCEINQATGVISKNILLHMHNLYGPI